MADDSTGNVELAILGGIETDPEYGMAIAQDLIKPDFFSSPRCKMIYSAFLALQSRQEPIDLVSVTSELSGKMKGSEIAGMLDYPTAGNLEYHCKKLRSRFFLGTLIDLGNTLSSADVGSDIDDLVGVAFAELIKIQKESSDIITMTQAVEERMKFLEENANDVEKINGISTGYPSIDECVGGVRNGELWFLSGVPSAGKTALANCMSYHQGRAGKTSIYFSAEMSRSALATRYIAIDMCVANLHRVSPFKIRRLLDLYYKRGFSMDNILVDDDPELTGAKLYSRTMSAKHKFGVDIVYVDYLQLLKADQKFETFERQIAEWSKTLKRIAKKADIPVVCISSLSREGNLKGSGDLQYDADVIAVVDKTESGGIELAVEKNRMGRSGDIIPMSFRKSITRFEKDDEGLVPIDTEYDEQHWFQQSKREVDLLEDRSVQGDDSGSFAF